MQLAEQYAERMRQRAACISMYTQQMVDHKMGSWSECYDAVTDRPYRGIEEEMPDSRRRQTQIDAVTADRVALPGEPVSATGRSMDEMDPPYRNLEEGGALAGSEECSG